MRYYVIAGEASGDLHASNLMKELKESDAGAQFRCWGGDLMQQQGGEKQPGRRDGNEERCAFRRARQHIAEIL